MHDGLFSNYPLLNSRRNFMPLRISRRSFIKSVGASAAVASLSLGSTAFAAAKPAARRIQDGTRFKMAFIQFMPHTVPAAWSQGIEEVLATQANVDYELLDG